MDLLERLDEAAEVIRTPCGEGSLVWRCWGDGPPLVLVHGGFGAWNHWVRNIEGLARDYRVIAPDMAGQGDSDDPPQPYDADSLAAILGEGLRHIIGDQPVRFVCFSFGAVIGGMVAASLGPQTTSFTGVGAAGMGERGPVTRTMIRVTDEMDVYERQMTLRHNLGILMFADPAKIDPLALYIQDINTRRNRIRSRPISLTDRLLKTFPDIQGRIGLIWGREDITATGFFEPRHTYLRSLQPDAPITILDGVGHWVQYEEAKGFNEALLNTLTS